MRGTSARPENIVICNGYAQGVGLIIGLEPYRISSDSSKARGALFFGYATLPERTIVEGVEILAEAIAEVR